MRWKFWEKETGDGGVKLAKPKDLPSGVGRYLVVDMKYDPDWVWSLKIVTAPKGNRKGVFDFRIYDPTKAVSRGVYVKNYNSLGAHPERILFDGWYDKDTWKMEINPILHREAALQAV